MRAASLRLRSIQILRSLSGNTPPRVSVYDKDDSVRKETVAQLNRAEGFIARELGRRIDIRRIPTLKFTLDDSIEYSVHISEIINKLQTERAQLDANRNNAEEDKENTQNED